MFISCLFNQGKRSYFLWPLGCLPLTHTFTLLWHILPPCIHKIPEHKLEHRVDFIRFYFSHFCVRGSPSALVISQNLLWRGERWCVFLWEEKKNLWQATLDTVPPQNKIKKNRWVYNSKIQNILSRWQDSGLDVLCFSGCAATLSSLQARSWWGLSYLALEGSESALPTLLAASQLVRAGPC